MAITAFGVPLDPSPPAPVAGLRFLHRARYFPSTSDANQPITLGRGRGHDIVIPQRSVSRLHCEIYQVIDGRFMIRDCGSRNGIYAPSGPDQRLKRVNWHVLQLGSPIYLGDVLVVPVDENGLCPIVATRHSEFVRKAGLLYNSIRAVCRLTGMPRTIARRFQVAKRQAETCQEIVQ